MVNETFVSMPIKRHYATFEPVPGYRIRGIYEGGPYIDLYFLGARVPFSVINVWDYETGRPTIPPTSAAVRRKMIEWAKNAGDHLADELAEYLRETVWR